MKYDRLYNFISPVTGKLPIDRGYILLGDKEGRSFASPILIDVRQDIIDLKRKIGNFEELKKLDHNRIWIGDYDNEPVEQLHIGIINLPPLAEAVFPNPISGLTGDFRIPNPTFDYLSAFDWVMSGPFLPQIYATKYDTFGNPIGTDISSSLAMTQVRAAQIMKRFDNANFIVGSSVVDFEWENPKMALIPEALKTLYGIGTTYTFTKAQSLGALETGLLKNTVSNGKGTLSKAISGEDYVNTADIPIGKLVILDPLYPLSGHKLIAPTDFSTRGNTANEFGYPVADTINVLTGIASKFEKLAITTIENNALIKSNNGELVKAVAGTDYVIPSVITDILETLNATASVVKNIIGVQSAVNIKDVTGTQATALTTAVKNAVGLAESAEITELSVEAADLITNKSALVEIEAQIAALAGVQTITTLGTILGFLGLAASGKAYGDYIRGQSLNIKNTYKSADLNDEAHNAVGDFEFRYPSGYSSDDRGFSTLWFDSHGRSSNHKAESGLRLFSWDSEGDHSGNNSPLAPLHIGLFGYQNKYNISPIPNPTPIYKGFIFEIPDFHNEDKDADDFRFPKRFGLYDVTRTISTIFTQRWGWDSKETIFEYNYSDFNFYKPVVLKEYTKFEKEVEFQANIKCSGTGALWMSNNGIWLKTPTDTNHGMIYDSTVDGLQFRGYVGFRWNKGTSGATELMRLTSSGLDLKSNKLINLANPVSSTDGANKYYVDNAVSSANSKLQYFDYWDTTYPIYVTRSMYINNSYIPFIREYGTYGYLNGSGSTGTATDGPVYDIQCNGRIRASEFNAWSSRNIKNILEIGKKVGEEASKIIQDMPIIKYNYKDPLIDGRGEFFGVISEEILNYLPNYVTTKEFRFTPNIMIFGKLNSIDYQYYTISFQEEKILDKSLIGKTIQIIKENSGIIAILESIDKKNITIKLKDKIIITEKDLDVFVYGTYDDCPTVSLKHLSELSLCALQNCVDRISKLEQKQEI